LASPEQVVEQPASDDDLRGARQEGPHDRGGDAEPQKRGPTDGAGEDPDQDPERREVLDPGPSAGGVRSVSVTEIS